MRPGIYIVTGATGGIGHAIVEEVLRYNGTEVIMAVRDLQKAEKIKKEHLNKTRLRIIPLDLSKLKSVTEFTTKVKSSGFHIAGLFNNAGTMPGKMIETSDGLEIATQVNFISTAILTELLLPSIEPGGGIVFTTSMTRRIAKLKENWDYLSKESHQRFVTYGRSKLMLTHYALDLSQRLLGKVRVNCSDPWIVNSQIIKMDNKAVDAMSRKLAPMIFRTPEEGAIPAIKAMEADMSGHIFTLRGNKPIPAMYAHARGHKIPQQIIKEWMEKLADA